MPLITNIGWNNWCLFPQDISLWMRFFGQQELSSSGLFICSSQLLSQRAALIWSVRVLIKLHPIQQWILLLCNLCQFDKVKVKLLSSVRLCDPMDCSLLGSSVHGIFQARVLEVANTSPGFLYRPMPNTPGGRRGVFLFTRSEMFYLKNYNTLKK